MKKVRMIAAASVVAATALLVAPASSAGADGCEGDPRCGIWQSPVCREEVPKAIRVAAGCFNIQP